MCTELVFGEKKNHVPVERWAKYKFVAVPVLSSIGFL